MNPVFKQLDPEAIRRVQQGIKPHSEAKPLKRKKPRRKAESYRSARRNEVLRGNVRSTWKGAKAIHLVPEWPAGKTYRPNGKRERARRARHAARHETQIAAE